MANATVPGIHGTGTHAARPAANAVENGAQYACTTHNAIEQSDGSSTWTTVLTGISSASGGAISAAAIVYASVTFR